MSKAFRFVVVLAVALLILASFTVAGLAQQIHVGFIATNFAAESHARVANAFESYARAMGWRVTMLDSRGSPQLQANQVEDLVHAGVDAIVIAMGRILEIRPALELVFEAGIPLITIDSGYTAGAIADITTDNYVMGARIASYLADRMNHEGNIILLKFEKHEGTRRRGKVLDVVLSENPNITVLEEYWMNATAGYMEDTRRAMETYVLRHGDKIDAVWAAFDELAYAAADVLEAHGLGRDKVIVVGIDGNPETFRRIRAGSPIVATVAQPFEEMARIAVDLVDKIVVQGISPAEAAPRKVIYVDAPLVDETNVPPEGQWPW